ncbi:hypothetical protein HMPREF9952_0727 [Haemophilus pittmaniae HK 85]|uniref:Uncharacterized protein n=1 Tax=Haemophilus pittmaniae HK 85 TaxID=1035188 RepID=F9Q9M4_9PAST|nr:hypothetical protein [Haemophilus pittmaniae]EGV05742.1 hypothetical protein HMPREF9952_0727 [Haemophilus pittmaniae HK 85]SNV66718.1 Uncharacterised protein [Haemophilus pittmaniae]
MSASSYSISKKGFFRGWGLSNNAKRNRAINGGFTAAQYLYLLWSY